MSSIHFHYEVFSQIQLNLNGRTLELTALVLFSGNFNLENTIFIYTVLCRFECLFIDHTYTTKIYFDIL